MAKRKTAPLRSDEGSSLVKTFESGMAPPKEEAEGKRSFLKYYGDDGAPLVPEVLAKKEANDNAAPTLAKSILNYLNGPRDSVERLAFETDPSQGTQYAYIFRPKTKLIPDALLKRILIQDDLIAAIVLARSNQLAAFGRPRPDRFSTGFVIEPNVGVVDRLNEQQKEELDKRIEAAVALVSSCGHTKGWDDDERCTFAQYLSMSVRNAVGVGRIATEIVWVTDAKTGEKKFHSFRPIDAGTIYRATRQKAAALSVRRQAKALLEQLKNKKLAPEKFSNDEYAWVQVIEGRPVQAFTAQECVVHNFYPVADVELDGYPVTPIDTMISAVITHINITTHNKIYFQTGRATRGMLVIKSDDVDETVVARVKQQFNASINSVNNAWRMPVFAVGSNDDISWSPIDNTGSRDMEFQYLTDMNARVILSAFQMAPEELPGWSYLSRGTNNQSLAESNNEYKLQAARDLGIRPLLANFEDFINSVIFPLIDPILAKICRLKLVGLEAETAEKESVRIQQDMPVHMTYDQVLEKVEKRAIGKLMGGEFPLNPQYQAILDKYFTVGQILEFFMGIPNASKDPSLGYFRDPFWFNFQNLQLQKQQMQMQAQQAQMAEQQAAAQGGEPGGENPAGEGVEDRGQPQGGEGPTQESPTENEKTEAVQGASAGGEDLTRSIDQAIAVLTKSEAQLPPSKRRILAQHRKTIRQALDGLDEELRHATKEIVSVAENALPRKRR